MLASEKIIVAPGWETCLQASGLDSVAGVYGFSGGEVIVRSGSTEVRRVQLREGAAMRPVFIKKYWASHRRQLCSGALRGTFLGWSKARREYRNLGRLRQWGLDAPAPVAYGEERRCRWLTRSFLMSEGVDDPCMLDVFIRNELARAAGPEDRAFRRQLIDSLARYVRRLHEHRFVHHDLFWRNVILSGHDLSHFYLIDAHKGGLWLPGAGTWARAKDLATLDAAAPAFFRRTERLRFLLGYLGLGRLDVRGRRLARRVMHAAAPQRAKQIRRVQEGRLIAN